MFQKATRQKAFLRLAFMGPAGSGKTYSALLLARHMGAKKIAVIDSERGSARLYANLVDFDVCELESFAVERYMDAIAFAQRSGYDFLIIDSLSHAWAGKDGILEYKDRRTEQSRSKDSFGAGWRDASPLHNKFIDSILAFRGHVIATLRTKTEYVIEEGANGKKTPRKIGMAPVQRDGVEYEFTVVGDFIDHNKLAITKTRIDALNDAVIYKPGREMADTIMAWFAAGEDAPPEPAPAPAEDPKVRADAEAAFAKTIADFPDHAAEINAVAERFASAVDALVALRSLYKRLSAAKAKPPAAPAERPVTPAMAVLLKKARGALAALAKDAPAAIAQAEDLVSQYGGLDGVAEADLPALVSELGGLYSAAVAGAAA